MSLIQPSTVLAIAQSVDIPKLTDDAAKALASDVEYRLREVIQEAQKFARHSGRQRLTTDDINSALRLKNVEPLYSFAGSSSNARFVRATGHPDVSFLLDRELTFEQVIDAPLPPPPVDVGVRPHWLFIEGVQPAIPENVAIERPPPPTRVKRTRVGEGQGAAVAATSAGGLKAKPAGLPARGGDGPASAAAALVPVTPGAAVPGAATAGVGANGEGSGVQVQPPVQLLVSRELTIYFDKVVAVVCGKGQAAVDPAGSMSSSQELKQQALQRQVMASLASDPGLHPLVPYFIQLLQDQVAAALKNVAQLQALLHLAHALLINPHMHLEPYVHRLMPTILTCLVAKNIGARPSEDHWSVRNLAGRLVSLLCLRFGEAYYNVHARVSKTLMQVLLATDKPLASHYGAITGLAALGHGAVRQLLVPHAEPLLRRLAPVMEDARSGLRRHEAWRVYGCLLDAVAGAMYETILAAEASRVKLHAARRSKVLLLNDDDASPVGPGSAAPAAALPGHPAVASTGPEQPPAAVAAPAAGPSTTTAAGQGTAAGPAAAGETAANGDASQGGVGTRQEASGAGHLGDRVAMEVDATAAPSAIQQRAGSSAGMALAAGAPASNAAGGSAPTTQSAAQAPLPPAATGNAPNPDAPHGPGPASVNPGMTDGGASGTGAPGGTNSTVLAVAGPASATAGPSSSQLAAPQGGGAAAAKGQGRAVVVRSGRPTPGARDEVRRGGGAAGGDGGTLPTAAVAAVSGRGEQREQAQVVRAVLAESWREDADLGSILWALAELFGEPFAARMPQLSLASAVL